jgi:hypothetical protein
MLTWLALTTTALAHPLGATAWSLRGGVEVGERHAVALVVGEVPMAVVARELRERAAGGPVDRAAVDAYTRARQREIADALTLTVDGAPVPARWEAAPSPINGRAVDGFFVYAVVATFPRPERPRATIVLHDGAWPDREVVYAAEARTSDPGTRVHHDGPSGWTPDPAARTLTIHVQRSVAPRAVSPGLPPVAP